MTWNYKVTWRLKDQCIYLVNIWYHGYLKPWSGVRIFSYLQNWEIIVPFVRGSICKLRVFSDIVSWTVMDWNLLADNVSSNFISCPDSVSSTLDMTLNSDCHGNVLNGMSFPTYLTHTYNSSCATTGNTFTSKHPSSHCPNQGRCLEMFHVFFYLYRAVTLPRFSVLSWR